MFWPWVRRGTKTSWMPAVRIGEQNQWFPLLELSFRSTVGRVLVMALGVDSAMRNSDESEHNFFFGDQNHQVKNLQSRRTKHDDDPVLSE